MEKETSGNILLVEDDETARKIATMLIKRVQGMNLFPAESGIKALEILAREPIDLVITDIVMPGLDGFELIERIRSTPGLEDVYIIIMTALDNVSEKIRGFELGANDYVTKPFEHKELAARITAGVRTVRLRRRLKETNRELGEALEFKRFLLDRAAHDLKTPITIINGYIKILKEKCRDCGDVEEYIENIERQSGIIASLSSDILDYADIEMGRLEIHLQKTNIIPIIRDAIELNRFQADEKNLRIIFECEEDIPQIMADPERIRAVFWNLINNAVKYSRKNKEILITVYKPDGKIIFSVTDHGIGIPEDKQESIFELFNHPSTPPEGKGKSIGLGLAITRQIVYMHGGNIKVESEAGLGSTFMVSLPLH